MSEPDPSSLDLTELTKAQLLDYAADTGVDGVNSSMRKAEILKTIEEAGE